MQLQEEFGQLGDGQQEFSGKPEDQAREESVDQSQLNRKESKKAVPAQEEPKQSSQSKLEKPPVKKELWKAFDFLFPGGKLAKLVKVFNVYRKVQPYEEILAKLKLNDTFPVLNVIGAGPCARGKFYAGVARACFNTDAVIVDNGLASGLEKFCLRRNVKLIGVAPEKQIKYPKINPTTVDPMELANGHSHIMLTNNPDGDLSWGGEVRFKVGLCKALAAGKKKGQPDCKIVCLLAGDTNLEVEDQLKLAVQEDYPIIVVPGSRLGDSMIANQGVTRDEQRWASEQLAELTKKGHFFYCNSLNSEDIAQLVHFLLVVRPW